MADQSQKTEKPSPRRLLRAREDGNFPTSRELVAGIQYLLTVWGACYYGRSFVRGGGDIVERGIKLAFSSEFNPQMLSLDLRKGLTAHFWPLLTAISLFTVFPAAIHIASTRLGFSTKKLRPDLKRISPSSKFPGILSQNAAAVASVLVVMVCIAASVSSVIGDGQRILSSPLRRLDAGLSDLASLAASLLWRSASVLILYGIVHYGWHTFQWQKSLKMSKQELRDEMKESEGSPEIKMRLRRLRRELVRRQMMRDIATATAVVTNPTHYAVAIRYNADTAGAPVVVAKGRDYLALRIRQRALEHGVPIVQNPPLAQALYKSVDIGQEIPPHLYRAIAEILAYIFRLMNDRGRR